MSRAQNVPDETDMLCEGCGYVLNGLPAGGNCPECGKPASESAATFRRPPAWESAQRHRAAAFCRTTIDCIFSPTRFFRSINVRPAGAKSVGFARLHWNLAAILLGTCGWLHAGLMGGLGPLQIVSPRMEWTFFELSFAVFFLGTYASLFLLNSLAASLTTWEATYRGLRLPRPIVLRALHYHSAHYLPIGLLALATVGGFKLFLLASPRYAAPFEVTYLYVLCGEVVLSAFYLFKTYWIAMRNLMYANRPEAAADATTVTSAIPSRPAGGR